MSFEFKCRNCGKIISITILKSGEQAYCQKCHTINIVPNKDMEYAEPPTGLTPGDPRFHNPIPGQSTEKAGVAPRKITEIIGETFRVFYYNFFLICAIYAVVYLPSFGFEYLVNTLNENPDSISVTVALLYLTSLFAYITVYFILSSFAAVAISYLICKYYLGQEAGFTQSYRIAVSRASKILPAYLLIAIILVMIAVTIIGIPVAIYFAVSWAVIVPVITLENHSITDSLSRSRSLTKNNLWKIIGVFILLFFIFIIPSTLMQSLPWYLSFLLAIPLYSIGLIHPTIIYFDLRARKEEYTLDNLKHDILQLDYEVGEYGNQPDNN